MRKMDSSQSLNPKASCLDLDSVFDGILDRNSDEEENEIKITYLKTQTSTGASSSKPTHDSPSPQKNNLFSLKMTEEEKLLLKSAAEGEPIARGTQSQNQRINAIAPKPKKQAKKKNTKKETKKEAKKKHKDERTEEPGETPMKRPSAAPSTLGLADEEDEEKLKAQIPEGVVEGAMSHARSLDPAEHSRQVRRQRTTSNAYHKSEVLLMKQGMSKEDAQAVGRVAGRMAGAQFDKEWPSNQPKAKAKSAAQAKSKSKPKKPSPKKKKNVNKNKKKIPQDQIETGTIPEEMDLKEEEQNEATSRMLTEGL